MSIKNWFVHHQQKTCYTLRINMLFKRMNSLLAFYYGTIQIKQFSFYAHCSLCSLLSIIYPIFFSLLYSYILCYRLHDAITRIYTCIEKAKTYQWPFWLMEIDKKYIIRITEWVKESESLYRTLYNTHTVFNTGVESDINIIDMVVYIIPVVVSTAPLYFVSEYPSKNLAPIIGYESV